MTDHPNRRLSLPRLAAMMAALALGSVLVPPPASAHGPPTPLDFWGAFGRRVARCQRIIGRAASTCALRAWGAARHCRLAVLQGGTCDEGATDAAIEAARLDAFDAVQRGCTDQQALMLVFLGRGEAQADVIQFCRQLEDSAVSAVFLPLAGGAAGATATRDCVEAAALATTKLLRQGFVSRETLLDRIAQRSYSPAEKQARLAASSAETAHAANALQLEIAAACPEREFTQAYGRGPAAFLSLIASRADCLADSTYAQGGVLCPAAQCGNGMREAGEGCDDGNLAAGDGCSATCARE